jgi:hypothetical protein
MTPPHSKLLDLAAKHHLAPLGLKRKGQSRTWLGDQHWYVVVVEFQPSGFAKGSFLNVGAHFLWQNSGHLSFDLGSRVEEFVQFQSEEQFAPEADRLAAVAATEVGRLRALLPGIQGVTSAIPVDSSDWPAYHRAIALGLCGGMLEASQIFAGIAESAGPVPWEVERAALCLDLQRLLEKPTGFRAAISELVKQQRQALRLPEIEGDSLGS